MKRVVEEEGESVNTNCSSGRIFGIQNRGNIPRIVMALPNPQATKGWARVEHMKCCSQVATEMSIVDARALAEKILASWPFGGHVIEEYCRRRLRFLIIKRNTNE